MPICAHTYEYLIAILLCARESKLFVLQSYKIRSAEQVDERLKFDDLISSLQPAICYNIQKHIIRIKRKSLVEVLPYARDTPTWIYARPYNIL